MQKVVLVVRTILEYPPPGDFKHYKKGQSCPKYKTKDKRAHCIQYNKRHKDLVKTILPLWKNHMRAVFGTHAYVREIPDNGANGLTIQKLKEDCEINVAVNSCVTYGCLLEIIQLNTPMETELESDSYDVIILAVWWLLCNLLRKAVNKENLLFRAIAFLEEGIVMANMCTGDGRDEELTNIAMTNVAWTMYKLLLELKAICEPNEAAVLAWFSMHYNMAAIDCSEYDQETGKVSFQDKIYSKEIGSESQEVIARGL